jgi:hypothetical protein
MARQYGNYGPILDPEEEAYSYSGIRTPKPKVQPQPQLSLEEEAAREWLSSGNREVPFNPPLDSNDALALEYFKPILGSEKNGKYLDQQPEVDQGAVPFRPERIDPSIDYSIDNQAPAVPKDESHIRFAMGNGPMQDYTPNMSAPVSQPNTDYEAYRRNLYGDEEVSRENMQIAKNEAYEKSYEAGGIPELTGRGGYRTIQTVDEQGRKITKVVPVSEALGQSYIAPPPAEVQAQASQYKRAAPILGKIGELSEKINVTQGAMAKITGTAERAAAELNMNDDISEYNALISAFTPLVARAVGHTGVLTQQDVDSVREMFPKPTDSKSIRDRKVALIMDITGQVAGTYDPRMGITDQYQGGASQGPMNPTQSYAPQNPGVPNTQAPSGFKIRRRLS